MNCQPSAMTAYGIESSSDIFVARPVGLRSGSLVSSPKTNPLERLVEIMNSNERLMDDLAISRERTVKARAYLDEPGCNARFGQIHLERCRVRHAGILTQLRANRIEALSILAPDQPVA